MPYLTGDSPKRRKESLATLVSEHLNTIEIKAEVIRDHVNATGHIDAVVVDSNIGLIHLTATGSTAINSVIPVSDYKDGSQGFLDDKDFVAFGWNDKDGRTFLMVVPVDQVRGKDRLQKAEIKNIRVREWSTVLPHI